MLRKPPCQDANALRNEVFDMYLSANDRAQGPTKMNEMKSTLHEEEKIPPSEISHHRRLAYTDNASSRLVDKRLINKFNNILLTKAK